MLKRIRSLVRFCVAATLWVHAAFLLDMPRIRFALLSSRLHTSQGEITVLILIAGFSILASYGWAKVAVDLIYIYFFPFVCLYYLGRWLVRFGLWLNQYIAPGIEAETTEAPYYTQIPLPTLVAAAAPSSPQIAVPQLVEPKQTLWQKILTYAIRPFKQFTLLWCLLLLLTTHQWLAYIALAIVSIHIFVLLIRVLKMSFTTDGWLSKIAKNLQGQMEDHIRRIIDARNAELTQETRQAWTALRSLLMGVNFLQRCRQIAQWAAFLGIAAFIVIYLYVALLFSFEYHGIARLQGIVFPWSNALMTAVFLPIAYPDLPHTNVLRLLGGVQWVCILALGTSTVVSVVRQKLKPFYAVADIISQKMDEEDVKATLILLKDKLIQSSARKELETKR